MSDATCSEADCPKPRHARGLCCYHYDVRYRAGTLPPNPRPTPEQTFWGNVEASASDGCWEWQRYRDRKGYGRHNWNGRPGTLAHRLAFQLATGIDPSGMLVCHHCDNPPCCNPAHLFLGTDADNAHDMIAKGRDRTSSPGEANPSAKVTEADVRTMRAMYASGVGASAIGARFGVTRSHARSICVGASWRHVA